ncbi:MAG: acyl-ACP--UDP-N-acetylglucosamine O-acyltransferase [Oceanipulchritudo sp.]
MKQHPTAVIHEATRMAEDVVVGPYAVIEDGVEIGKGCVIREHAVIRSGTILGKGCVVDAHAVIGGLPQDLGFNPKTPSGVRVGERVTFREGVTVNRATVEGAFTEIGDHCFLMAESHVGHDCRLGSHVILANAVLLAGKVTVGDHTFIGGTAAVHQFCRIGESTMVGGVARVSQDVPPFCMMSERNELIGLNLVGLQRRGVPRETLRELKKLYHMVFGFEGRPRVLAEGALKDGLPATAEGKRFLEFIAGESRKGMMRPRKSRGGEPA